MIFTCQRYLKKYRNFNNLWKLYRKIGESLASFAGDWHAKYHAYQNVAGNIPSETAAMMLLTASKLSAEERQSVKLNIGQEITYVKVREVIKIIGTEKEKKEERFETLYSEKNKGEEQEEQKPMSGHETLISRNNIKNRGESSHGRQTYRSNRNRHFRGKPYKKYERNYRNYDFRGMKERSIMNQSKYGQTMTCHFCGSKYDLIRDYSDYNAAKE